MELCIKLVIEKSPFTSSQDVTFRKTRVLKKCTNRKWGQIMMHRQQSKSARSCTNKYSSISVVQIELNSVITL
jgi:hypothetical protein